MPQAPPPTPLEVPALDGLDGWMDGGRAVASTVGFGWWGEEVATPGALGPTTCRLSSVAPFNPDMCILPTEFGFPHSAFCLVSHRGGGGEAARPPPILSPNSPGQCQPTATLPTIPSPVNRHHGPPAAERRYSNGSSTRGPAG